MKNHNNKLISLALTAMFIGIGLVLPFLTGQIQQIGNMLLPMHLPVMLCGLICLLCKKNIGLKCAWAVYLPLWLILTVFIVGGL